MTAVAFAGVWIGSIDLVRHGKMQRHIVLDNARRTNYPEFVEGRTVGGFWAYARCGDPAYWYEDGTAAARALPECLNCWTSPSSDAT